MISKTEWLSNLKPGDMVTRMLAGLIPMHLKVSKVDDLIHCGLWTFSRRNGAEIDQDLPSTETLCASYIIPHDPTLKANDAPSNPI